MNKAIAAWSWYYNFDQSKAFNKHTHSNIQTHHRKTPIVEVWNTLYTAPKNVTAKHHQELRYCQLEDKFLYPLLTNLHYHIFVLNTQQHDCLLLNKYQSLLQKSFHNSSIVLRQKFLQHLNIKRTVYLNRTYCTLKLILCLM